MKEGFTLQSGRFPDESWSFQHISADYDISWIVSPWIYHHLRQVLDYDAIYQVPIPEFTIMYQVPIKDIPHRIGFQDFYHLDLAVQDRWWNNMGYDGYMMAI